MDSGTSWQASGLGQGTVTELAASPLPGVRVYAATPRGVWVLEDRP